MNTNHKHVEIAAHACNHCVLSAQDFFYNPENASHDHASQVLKSGKKYWVIKSSLHLQKFVKGGLRCIA
jgi:hypothetical protein